jgi:NADH:ubiquinone oxidoreductase subunit 6 (subunit J)
MGIGASIFLLVVGAILAFAVSWTVQGLDLEAVGIILMIAGGIGLAVTLAMMMRSSGTTQVTEYYEDPARRSYRRDY